MKRRRVLSLMGTAALASGLLLTGCGGGEAADCLLYTSDAADE